MPIFWEFRLRIFSLYSRTDFHGAGQRSGLEPGRLRAGYLDHPPLAMFLLAASRAVFGVSQLGLRVLPVEAFIKYSAAMGVKPSTPEGHALSQLPQFYADMFGWEGLARDVSAVYTALPGKERASAVVLARDYGEAGALEYYAGRYLLPRIISTHNSYWYWGYPEEVFRTVIVLGGSAEDHRKSCDEVTMAAIHTCRYCMPYENDMPIYICRGVRVKPAEIWNREKNFE